MKKVRASPVAPARPEKGAECSECSENLEVWSTAVIKVHGECVGRNIVQR